MPTALTRIIVRCVALLYVLFAAQPFRAHRYFASTRQASTRNDGIEHLASCI